MAEIAWQITVYLATGLGPTGLCPRKKMGDIIFCPHENTKNWPKPMQGGRDIRSTESELTESWHFHSLYGWVKYFIHIFNKLPYSFCLQADKIVLLKYDKIQRKMPFCKGIIINVFT